VSASFEALWVRELWKGFVALQLEEAASSPRLRQSLDRAASFFAALEKAFACAQEIDAKSLAERMDSRLLRKHLLASRFLAATLGLDETEGHRELVTERRRIAQIISRCEKAKYGVVLAQYVEWLRAAGVADRTARLYLRAAESFCADVGVDASQAWCEQDALRYLAKMPGHAASLSRFFRYCRECRGWDVRLPPRALWAGTSEKRAADKVKRLRKALQRVGSVDTATLTTREVARILSIAVSLPAAQLLRERSAGRVVLHGDGSVELGPQAVIAAVDALYPYARRWLALAAREQTSGSNLPGDMHAGALHGQEWPYEPPHHAEHPG
jgi:ribosomal protein L29